MLFASHATNRRRQDQFRARFFSLQYPPAIMCDPMSQIAQAVETGGLRIEGEHDRYGAPRSDRVVHILKVRPQAPGRTSSCFAPLPPTNPKTMPGSKLVAS